MSVQEQSQRQYRAFLFIGAIAIYVLGALQIKQSHHSPATSNGSKTIFPSSSSSMFTNLRPHESKTNPTQLSNAAAADVYTSNNAKSPNEYEETSNGFVTMEITKTTAITKDNADIENNTPAHETSNNKILYGHMHISNTSGLALLDLLAGRYDRVCSNSASSRDFDHNFTSMDCPDGTDVPPNTGDWNNNLEECDYVSSQKRFRWWIDTHTWDHRPIEMHLPCRDPIDMLVSHCFTGEQPKGWDCKPGITVPEIDEQIFRCLGKGDNSILDKQFGLKFLRLLKNREANATVKCYDDDQTLDHYVDYMDQRLEHREPIVQINMCRASNPYQAAAACLYEDENLRAKVKRRLLNYYYYFKYCQRCLPTSNNLFSP